MANVQTRRCVQIPAEMDAALTARVTALGVSKSSVLEGLLRDLRPDQIRGVDRPWRVGRPAKVVEPVAEPMTARERSVLARVPTAPTWAWTDEVVGLMRRTMGRLSVIEMLDNLHRRGLVRRKRQTGRQAKWQRIEANP